MHRAIGAALALAMIVMPYASRAHDAEHPDQDAWYAGLRQPDNPSASCCGEADAYWCDGLKTKIIDGETHNFCIITDDRDDAPLHRVHVPVGTEIDIPNHKLKWDAGNPTGHAVVFLGRPPYLFVWCFVQNGGV
jgi:hypothetical protein